MSNLPAPTITLRTYGNAVLAELRTRYGAVVPHIGLIQPTDPDGEPEPELETPAILLRVLPVELDREARSRPGRVPTRVEVAAQVVLSIATDDLQLELAEFAADLMALAGAWGDPGARVDRRGQLVQGNRWGLGDAVEPVDLLQCQESLYAPGLHGRDSLTVTWEQVVYRPASLTNEAN